MSQIDTKSQDIIEVKIEPGGPVHVRALDPTDEISGYVVGPEHKRVARRAVPVFSELDEYQDSLEEYRFGILQQIGIDAHRERGRVIAELSPKGLIYLDVSACNHVPREIFGTTVVEVSMGDQVRFAWEAWLVSVERVDEGAPMRPYRMVAGYRVALREGGET